jgi:beta-lactamase regulating signal transducer with metallopeptidase domain
MDSLVFTLLNNALAVTVMAVVVVSLAWIFRRPAVTHCLWLIVLLKLISPPLMPISLPVGSFIPPIESSRAPLTVDHASGFPTQVEVLSNLVLDERPQRTDDVLSAVESPRVTDDEPVLTGADDNQVASGPLETALEISPERTSVWRWEPTVLAIILAGALGWWTLATVRVIRFQRLLKHVSPVPGEWQSHADELAVRMGLGSSPSVCLLPGRVPPMLWAIGRRPRLLVPSELWTKMAAAERTSLLLHELAHLRRRDHWVRWLEFVVIGLYWWHPVVWWARRHLREAEEQCCDAWVVWAMPERARTYAAALLAAVEFVSGAPTAPAIASATSGSGHVSCLKRRLKMIVRARTPKGLSWAGRIVVLGMAALVLPLAPSWGRNDKAASIEPDQLAGVERSQSPAEIQTGRSDDRLAGKTVQVGVDAELQKDPELAVLAREIDTTSKQLRNDPDVRGDLERDQERQLAKIQTEINLKKSMLEDLNKKRNQDNQAGQSQQNGWADEYLRKLMAGMGETDLELIEAMSMLEINRAAYQARQQGTQQQPQQTDAKLLALVTEKFTQDPEVVALKQEVEETQARLARLKGNVGRQAHDPAVVAAQKQLSKLEQDYKSLWNSKYQEIVERVSRDSVGDAPSLAAIQKLEEKVENLKKKQSKLTELLKVIPAERKTALNDSFEAAMLSQGLESLQNWEGIVKGNLERLRFERGQLATEKRLTELKDQYEKLRSAKQDRLLAQAPKDDNKNDKADDDKAEKARDAAERFHEQLKDLLEKVGKELSPVAEEVRKSLEKAVGEIHKSLEKEGLSPEDLAKALDKSHEELRKAFEGGGPVDKELRDAIDKASKDLQEAFDRTRGDVENKVDSLREQSRDLRDQAREAYDRARDQARRDGRRDSDGDSARSELESARREIRDLEQKLRSATRRLEELEQRESRRDGTPRRGRTPQPEPRPRAEPAPPREPAAPATPARPARPNTRRGVAPNRPGPGAARRNPQIEENDRLRELEDKMNRLLKELENLKGEKSPKENKEPSSGSPRPAKEGARVIS